ncbi:T9SS type A sorting domain-containing protein [Mucilaginibacter hurinus]|uniref:T9SS type A sorting domain-containing protein n=1 Tax=Mucilaginibacter hurinus TaxID=2201324 RepID=UPI001314A375|nr:T9SS type A sorting domain-containing protein [Mucilaginibacter hurinus]
MLKKFTSIAFLISTTFCALAQQRYFTMDMVHHNPGDTLTRSRFLDPAYLKSYGYDAKVFFLTDAPQVGITWEDFDDTIFPVGSKQRKWVDDKDASLQAMYNDAKSKGVKVYCAMDMLVLPTALFNKYRDSIASQDNGKNYRIDITKPATQKLFRYMLQQIFKKYPQVDALVIRTGEIYTQNAPYHKGNNPAYDQKFDNHTILVNILRDEVCVKLNKKVIYRTWDDGRFHSRPSIYLQVTDKVIPHQNLFFSIKHVNVDFWRMGIPNPNVNLDSFNQYFIPQSGDHGVWFNPTLGIGKHKQFVEVQCQREYEGKATHPNYIAKGVIDGFEEHKKPGLPALNSLNELKKTPLLAGVWTWSRGGGWGGPKVPNEFWADMNAFVVAKWGQNPSRSEDDIFKEYTKLKGLPDNEIEKLHKIALLSDEGVMKGQWSTYGTASVAWTRDMDYMGTSTGFSYLGGQVDKWIKAGTTEKYLAEKAQALEIWKQIEALSKELHFKDPKLTHFVQTSCTYGRLKYQTFMYGWNVMVRGVAGTKPGKSIDQRVMGIDIAGYDQSVADWKKLAADNADCGTVYNTAEFEKTVAKYRAGAIYTDAILSYAVYGAAKKLKADFTTALKFHNLITIEQSSDNTKTWTSIGTIPGNRTTPLSNFSVETEMPGRGLQHYRVKLYDTLNNVVTSLPLTLNIKPNAVIINGRAMAESGKVKLQLITAQETFNPGCTVYKSTDGVNWTILSSVSGAGTKFTESNYTAYDNSPAVGTNYYKLNYFENGEEKTSPVRTAIVAASGASRAAVTFSVYPNPAPAGKVSFDFSGYKGRSITATVTDLYGKTVYKEAFFINPAGSYTLNTKAAPGTYVLTISGENVSKAEKVVIQ